MEKKLIGYVAVDSGQLLVTDPCYLKDFTSNELETEEVKEIYDYSYDGCCNATLNSRIGGCLGFKNGGDGAGVAFVSGWGDGMYPVYAYIEYETKKLHHVSEAMYAKEINHLEVDTETMTCKIPRVVKVEISFTGEEE